MPRHPVSQYPEGYDILRVNRRQYPVMLFWEKNGAVSARGFIQRIDGTPVSYSKRVYAANFLASFDSGRAPWAEVFNTEKSEFRKEAQPC